ncbi:MAG TPA: type II secretion system F family protein [Opitutaceae bacterium]|nr:type II secretion system F family protein [Opitutaceae bacterium]
MPRFLVTTREPDGQISHGEVEAPTRRDAARAISGRGARPLAINEAAEGDRRRAAGTDAEIPPPPAAVKTRWTRKQRLPFLQALLRLVAGGLSAGEAVRLLALRLQDPALRGLAGHLWEQLGQGRSLSQAMGSLPEVFDHQTLSLITAGEATGNLREVLDRLIRHFQTQRDMQRQLLTAMAYPVAVCVLAFGVILFFLFFLLPKVQGLLTALGGRLPPATQILVVGAEGLLRYGPFLVGGLVFAGVLWWRWRRTPGGRASSDRLLLRLPLTGAYARRSAVLNFAHTTAILLENGITPTESLRLSERTIGNLALREGLHAAVDRVLEGESLARALGRTQLFPALVLDQLAVGEQTGNLAPSLRTIADDYQVELSHWLRGVMRIVSSAMLVGAFTFVAFLAYAIVSAVLQISQSFRF